jgi:uncharacterized protein (TIGR01777 family)
LRVVISGGTGFIGRSLVRTLVERGDDVVVLSRGGHGGREGCGDGLGARPRCCRGAGTVELATWTPEKAGEWQKVVEGADAVVQLAGAALLDESWTPERKEVLRSSRIRSTELLAEAIAKAEKKPRVFVSGSAVGYYGIKRGAEILTEESAPGDDFLARLVVDWEASAAAAREAGVRVCHPRIGLVLGRHGGMLEKMLPAFKAYVGGPVGTGAQYMGWIHIDDTVRSLEHALDTDLSGAFNVTAPDPITMDAFARALGEAMNRPALLRVPCFAVELALGARSEAVLNGQRAVPEVLSKRGFAFVFPEISSALADILTNP